MIKFGPSGNGEKFYAEGHKHTEEAAKYCKNLGIEVVIAPVDSRARTYGSAMGLTDACTTAYDISFEMATTKVLLALGSGKRIEEELKKNNFFEKLY